MKHEAMLMTLQQLANGACTGAAFVELCPRYKSKGDNYRIPHLRFHWQQVESQAQRHVSNNGIDWLAYHIKPVEKEPPEASSPQSNKSQHQSSLTTEQDATEPLPTQLKIMFGLSVNKTSLQNYFNKRHRLYE